MAWARSSTDNLATECLSPTAAYKPLDVGNGRLAASVAADGALLALSGPHPTLGAVTLGAAAAFPDDRRHDPAAVRAYREALAAPDAAGFGLSPRDGWTLTDVGLVGGAIPRSRLGRGPAEATVTTWAPTGDRDGATGVVQRWVVHGLTDEGGLAWRGRLGLGRSALTQLTEGGVLPAPVDTVEATFAGGTLTLRVPGVAAAAAGLPAGEAFARRRRGPVKLAVPCTGWSETSGPHEIVIAWALGRDAEDARRRAEALRASASADRLADDAERWRSLGDRAVAGAPAELAPLVRRGVTYPLACCAWRVGDSVCLVTDHQILPLSWTRDAYYLTQALLARPGPDTLDVVGRHLRWLFKVADRPVRLWARAYLPNGRVKDPAFQLDQQCYPLLELVDYAEALRNTAGAAEFAPAVRDIVSAILERRAAGTEFIATDETPADDPMPLPYHLSSHVVLWWTLQRLIVLAGPLGLDAAELAARSDRLRRDIRRHFTVARGGRRMFAYAVDLEGGATCYHDANDLPTALAPLWGFCAPTDAVWHTTMRWAFSPSNPAGWFAGRFGGLGSVHTPAPWPLGDVQELVVARLIGDRHRAAAATSRLLASASWDGALPEARDPDLATVRSRHWFAWPGAALAAALTHRGWQPRSTASGQ